MHDKERHMAYDGPVCTSVISTNDKLVAAPSAIVTFYQPLFTQIRGPFKFYVKLNGSATATDHDFVVEPGSVYQKWEPNGKSVDAHFSLSLVGGATKFSFFAVTLYPGGDAPPYIAEAPLVQNVCPNP